MTTILTATEASNVLRCTEDDPNMLDLLPLVDDYLKDATGRDWTLDKDIYPKAKAAARMLLVRWHEDPGGMAAGEGALGFGLKAILVQLKVLALQIRDGSLPLAPLALVDTNLHGEMVIATEIILTFSNPMSTGAPAKIRLENGSGNIVATTNSLSADGYAITLHPTSSLTKNTAYEVILNHPADIYGQTLDTWVDFWTEDEL